MERKLTKAEYADTILKHYIVIALKGAGVPVHSDTLAELNDIITDAIDEAVDVAVREALNALPPSASE